jgi:hypothetical protein
MSSESSGFGSPPLGPKPPSPKPCGSGKEMQHQMLRVAAEAEMEALTYPQREICAVVEV